jgi:hypothetical protein
MRGLLTAVLAAALLLTACGKDEADVDESLRSSAEQPFALQPADGGTQTVTGHGIVLEVPAEWEPYDEKDSVDGTTYEWAVSSPDGDPAPSYVQFSMGRKGKGGAFEQLRDGAKELGELDDSFELLDEGEADVPGAERADFLRFHLAQTFDGQEAVVEQLQLFVELPEGEVSTIRFIAPEGEWEDTMQEVYDSFVVAQAEQA